MKMWIKISSENRKQGAWFFDLQYAKKCARSFEKLIPVDLGEWMEVADDHSHEDGEFAGTTFPDLVDEAYRLGFDAGRKVRSGNDT